MLKPTCGFPRYKLSVFLSNTDPELFHPLSLWEAVMWAFLHSDQTIRDVLPACAPLHHQHVLIWGFALQQLARRGCACSYEEESVEMKKRGRYFLTYNVWNVCLGCHFSRGRAGGEDAAIFFFFFWLLSNQVYWAEEVENMLSLQS